MVISEVLLLFALVTQTAPFIQRGRVQSHCNSLALSVKSVALNTGVLETFRTNLHLSPPPLYLFPLLLPFSLLFFLSILLYPLCSLLIPPPSLLSSTKIVGGMTWCIQASNFDVDVDLLFQENSTIGQKM